MRYKIKINIEKLLELELNISKTDNFKTKKNSNMTLKPTQIKISKYFLKP